jgi:N-acetyl sugar amidotransferase
LPTTIQETIGSGDPLLQRAAMNTQDGYRVCSRCVHDTTDPDIVFDENGVCNHCHFFDTVVRPHWRPDEEGEKVLLATIKQIKEAGRGKPHDSILGLSGGVDSSYLAVKMHEYGLRPLVFHVDAGWNSEAAIHNIERVVKHCGYDLVTHVLNWKEVRDLQLAYLKAGVPNQDVVQDHGFFATMYRFAEAEGIRWVLNGGNFATESVFPLSWHHGAMDAINLRAIHRRFGTVKLRDYKTVSFWRYYIQFPYLKRMRIFRPLNFMPYNKAEALKYLKETVGYKPYGAKHGESRWTKFFQNYFLPQRFGFDKRRPHLSSMILSGEITREEAMRQLEQPLYDEDELRNDKDYVARKLGISVDELESYVQAPLRQHSDYPTWEWKYKALKSVQAGVERLLGRSLRRYS